MMFPKVAAITLAAACLFGSARTQAQEPFPNRLITIVAPITAGTAIDIMARLYADKLSKRFDSDISAVCAAFALDIEKGVIVGCRIAFGGMAATPRRAPAAEAALTGRAWTEATARAGMEALAADYTPLTDMRASAGYRSRSAQNLLYRFFLETRADHPLPATSLSVFAAA